MPCIGTHGMNKSTHVLYNTLIPPIKRVEFWGFISFGVRLAKALYWEWGILRKLLGDP